MKINKYLQKIYTRLTDTRAAGLYIILFAVAIAVATFIDNDFGTSSGLVVIFKSWWFELLLFLFSLTLIANIRRFRMIQNRRWGILTFHLAMIIILIGAGVTRYFGYEGIMHIREGDTSNSFISAETYLQFELLADNQKFKWDEPVLFSSLGNNSFNNTYLLNDHLVEVELQSFIPNPAQVLETSDEGLPTIKIVFGGASGRQEYFVSQGYSRTIGNAVFNFEAPGVQGDFDIYWRNDSLFLQHDQPLTQMIMATQSLDTLEVSPRPHLLRLRSLYSNGDISFVFGDFNPKANLVMQSADRKVRNESMTALDLKITIDGEEKSSYVYGKKHLQNKPSIIRFKNSSIAIGYGAKTLTLPFDIKLYDFQMERYPGTNSAASYASEVRLIDSNKNYEKDYRIFMNNILDYKGYRFFQSSFDQDEKGTYLSVNHDFWGTWISYLGYFLLTVGMIIIFFSKRSRFSFVVKQLKKMRTVSGIVLLLLITSFGAKGQTVVNAEVPIIEATHAAFFSKVLVQDHKGRMKPVHTLSRELLRKVSRSESYNGYNADQVILSMFAYSEFWLSAKLIKMGKNEAVKDLLDVRTDYASYKDFFNQDGSYKMAEAVRRAYGLQPIDRGTFEKEVMKLDERINILSMMFSGRMFKIIPIPGDPNNTWASSRAEHGDAALPPVAVKFFPAYKEALQKAMSDGNYELPNLLIQELTEYQQEHGSAVTPSQTKVSFEVLLNKLKVFDRLSIAYLLLGMAFLTLLFINVFRGKDIGQSVFKTLLVITAGMFVFHTAGLGIRWYVSGRAPWSNGYESMIYIAWTSCLAGLIFTRKSTGGLAATMVLAGTILLVAKLSYLDPEITPLVPVLRSYWLTIHVSLIAGSYGFLMLGALIGLINLILFVFLNDRNKERVKRIVTEMSYISEITLIGGLVMISVGTYLGGVWANESWGRYWGWDAKETWALVTILVYAFILHMRIIPKLHNMYTYNLSKLFGWASVIMTYFGVNYYLSGLHSYAAGDPVPIPNWVYISVVSITIIAILAYFRKRIYLKDF
ncbi:MAG: cytochrome c biogenesis protein CcsA [Saprospiraceae bacterium]|nr:cytochrome c biogenesis protein CcsA [Saprospiraceae bacterium]